MVSERFARQRRNMATAPRYGATFAAAWDGAVEPALYSDAAFAMTTRRQIATSAAVATAAVRTTLQGRPSRPAHFATANTGIATASTIRKLRAARTTGVGCIARARIYGCFAGRLGMGSQAQT